MQQKSILVFCFPFTPPLWSDTALYFPPHNSENLREWIKIDLFSFSSSSNVFQRFFLVKRCRLSGSLCAFAITASPKLISIPTLADLRRRNTGSSSFWKLLEQPRGQTILLCIGTILLQRRTWRNVVIWMDGSSERGFHWIYFIQKIQVCKL